MREVHTKYNDTHDNIARILNFIPTPTLSTHIWEESLPSLHNLHITPPPFRQNIWLKTNKLTRNRIKTVYHNILQTVVS